MLSIERATGEDVDLVRDLLSETWVDTYAPHMSRATIEQVTTHWHNRELLRSQIEKPGDYFAVAKQDCKIVGLITVIVVGPQELHLPRLYVHPEHQRKGIGTRLLQAALAQYPDAMVVRLQVDQQNPKGLSYWRKQGFVEVGTNFEEIGADRVGCTAGMGALMCRGCAVRPKSALESGNVAWDRSERLNQQEVIGRCCGI